MRDLEHALRDMGFSRSQARGFMAVGYKGIETPQQQLSSLAADMRDLARILAG